MKRCLRIVFRFTKEQEENEKKMELSLSFFEISFAFYLQKKLRRKEK